MPPNGHVDRIAIYLQYLYGPLFPNLEDEPMADDLHRLIRATYESTMRHQRDAAVAFEGAVEMVLRRRPLLTIDEARREVSTMLAVEPSAAEEK
jgi:hypothetical protein